MAFSARLYESSVQPAEATQTPRAILVPVRNDAANARETTARDSLGADRRWPVPVRFAVIFGCAAACWAVIGIPLLLIWG